MASTHQPGIPRGPRLPAAVQGMLAIYRPTDFFAHSARRFGPNFEVKFPFNRPLIFVSDPEVIHQIFAGDPDVLHAGKANAILKPIVGSYSLLLLDGLRHRRDRKLMMPMFHGERMRAYGETMQQITARHIDNWPVGETMLFHPAMQSLTLDIILATVFGVEGPLVDAFRAALSELLSFGDRSLFMLFINSDGDFQEGPLSRLMGSRSPLTQYTAAKERVNQLLFEEFERRRKEADWDRPDVLTLLMQAEFEDGSKLTDEELRDEMLTLLVAGHETTATSLSWLLTWLYRYPGALKKVRDETATLGGDGPVPSDLVGKMEYTFAAIKESLRMTPVIPAVARVLQEDLDIGPLRLRAGQAVAPNIYLTHQDPTIWGDPERFRPERFLEQKFKPWQFLPFGGGNRTCLGMAFAYYEMRIVISEIARRTKFRLAPGYIPKVIRRNITFSPSEGVPVVFDGISGRANTL